MVWKKGETGNPGGLNPRLIAMKRRLDGLTIKAVDALEFALDNGTTSERIAAAREVFDRAVGKAKQQATVEVTHSASPHLVALTAMAAQTLARVQNGVQSEDNSQQVIDVTGYRLKPTGSDASNVAAIEMKGGERDDE